MGNEKVDKGLVVKEVLRAMQYGINDSISHYKNHAEGMDDGAERLDPDDQAPTTKMEHDLSCYGSNIAVRLNVLKEARRTNTASNGEVAKGSLVEAILGSEKRYYLIFPGGNGISVPMSFGEVTVISPETPIAKSLMGKKVHEKAQYKVPAGKFELVVNRIY
jgi:hypothetical protein